MLRFLGAIIFGLLAALFALLNPVGLLVVAVTRGSSIAIGVEVFNLVCLVIFSGATYALNPGVDKPVPRWGKVWVGFAGAWLIVVGLIFAWAVLVPSPTTS